MAVGLIAGGAVGYAAGQNSAAQNTVVYGESATLPCTPNVVNVEGAAYYQCGSSWYTEAYGNAGVIYMPVAAPAGY